GVTGTKGKGTTASLIYEILKKAGKRVWLGGNIGVAPFEFIDKIKKNDWVALELSSFQLEDMIVSPHIAVITNFYSEHLAPADPNNPNYHKSLKDYQDAKFNIIKWQKSGDKAVLNYELRITNYELNTKGKKIYFKKSELPSKLIGEHNKENIAAAVEVAKIVGIKQEIIKKAVAGFKGLEHRLELVREYKGVKYYDDSFATTPEASIIALKSFNQPVVILLGGADKGSDFKQLAEEVKRRCKFVVLLNGQATNRIKQELIRVSFLIDKMKLANNIKEAVVMARQKAGAGDIVLLSTACASFGMFKNYKERGSLFRKQVGNLK
ncbi:UDP-N-acetylmuramoyl-L-alanine--D-glutamate ligase, partial [Candidatus Falkowbacteria bacterium]|nr:UDP-N-acetylmuramoyl-L-alanine--D-glutamate ligase [Candidatus Falkowbacteria bacterium]